MCSETEVPVRDPEVMRVTERRRLAALVARDLATADLLHADDYQLITPTGTALSKARYLGDIASGELAYDVFEPASEIIVRGASDLALLRYQARITVRNGGPPADLLCWHTDSYELRNGRWQAVWSQATAIRE
jgi:phage baseplate assembly protein W